MRITKSRKVKFWQRVNKASGRDCCWLFNGGSKNGMHGTMPDGEYAHRFSWRVHFGAIPRGMNVLHFCDVGRCVRPTHLFLGTQLDNIADMRAKGRGANPPVHHGEKHPLANISDIDVCELRRVFAANRGRNQREIARMFNCSQSTVWRIGHKITR